MDEIVAAALRKWPNVPHCHGWLALDARGDWYMRDERIQRAGPFPQVKGSRITHDKLREFIHRNYDHDAAGGWFFQNGPQRVYVELEATPWVWRLEAPARGEAVPAVRSHTGRVARIEQVLIDEAGRLYLAADLGLGLVHSLDVPLAVAPVEAGLWQPREVRADELPARFGFQRAPQPERAPVT